MGQYRLEDWDVVSNGDPYMAPEQSRIQLRGIVFDRNDEYFKDGDNLLTSVVELVDGKKVITVSGSVYILGKVSEKYEQWMKDNNIPFDPENPIKNITSSENIPAGS